MVDKPGDGDSVVGAGREPSEEVKKLKSGDLVAMMNACMCAVASEEGEIKDQNIAMAKPMRAPQGVRFADLREPMSRRSAQGEESLVICEHYAQGPDCICGGVRPQPVEIGGVDRDQEGESPHVHVRCDISLHSRGGGRVGFLRGTPEDQEQHASWHRLAGGGQTVPIVLGTHMGLT